jgi:hypothetical protein
MQKSTTRKFHDVPLNDFADATSRISSQNYTDLRRWRKRAGGRFWPTTLSAALQHLFCNGRCSGQENVRANPSAVRPAALGYPQRSKGRRFPPVQLPHGCSRRTPPPHGLTNTCSIECYVKNLPGIQVAILMIVAPNFLIGLSGYKVLRKATKSLLS